MEEDKCSESERCRLLDTAWETQVDDGSDHWAEVFRSACTIVTLYQDTCSYHLEERNGTLWFQCRNKLVNTSWTDGMKAYFTYSLGAEISLPYCLASPLIYKKKDCIELLRLLKSLEELLKLEISERCVLGVSWRGALQIYTLNHQEQLSRINWRLWWSFQAR